MKKNLLSLLAIGAMLFGVSACSSDEPNPTPTPEDGDGIGYLALSISSDLSRSRANDGELSGNEGQTGTNETIDGEIFNVGETYEYAICPYVQSNVALFFDKDGEFYGSSYLTPFSNDGDHSGSHASSYPEQFYTYISRWRNDMTNESSTSTASKPSQVLVLLNVNPDCVKDIIDKAKSGNLNAVLNEEVENTDKHTPYGVYTYNGTQYFSMSNSVYVDDKNNQITATSFDETCICKTPEEALQNRVTVYVERMLAKFEVTFGTAGQTMGGQLATDIMFNPFSSDKKPATVNYVEVYPTDDDNLDYPEYQSEMTWSAYIVNWGMNAIEPNSYYFKQINQAGTYFDAWNNSNLHRSYWAESKNYNNVDAKLFPTQYRNSSYDPDNASLGEHFWGWENWSEKAPKGQSGTETALTYYSFNHFTERAKYKYAAERTYDQNAVNTAETKDYKGYSPYRYATHVIIGAQLILNGVDKLQGAGEDYMMKGVEDKWYAYGFFWGDVDSYIRYAYHRMSKQLCDGILHTANINGKQYTLKAQNGTLYNADGSVIDVYDAIDVFETAPAQLIHGDGKIVLNPIADVYYKNEQGELHKLDKEELVAWIYHFTDPCQHFAKGAMYYAIPVQHKLGKSEGKKVDIVREFTDGEDGTTAYKTGQFGTVRNHWYKLNVSAIGNIGTPVDDPDQPIIPDPEENYNIALEIIVLPWHIIDNGSFDL